MGLLSQSQTDNIVTMMSRIKERALSAQKPSTEDDSTSKRKGLFDKPTAAAPTTDDFVANTIRSLRQKADIAMEEQPEIYLSKYDVSALTPEEPVRPRARPEELTIPETTQTNSDIEEAIVEATGSEGLMSKSSNMMARPENLDIPEYKVYKSPKEMSKLEILARTIEAEAAQEGYEGMIAVGSVIANRAASGKHGDDIEGVILKEGQFSPWNSWTGGAKGEQGKDMLALKPSAKAYKAASAILTGDYTDPTDGATHYVNTAISQPDWLSDMKARKRGTLQIGNHLFGNADDDNKYDGKNWIKPKPKARP
jgi:spore germination cell wall hydrolase CwlJ-like protein